ncbi:MAG: hypothetical protein RSF92_13495 [Niameybacter sp.]|uniref:hypothetical protein n=1 Tax=Niameybacter sp. TaxID=2033640 RepID=UPI002FCC8E2D
MTKKKKVAMIIGSCTLGLLLVGGGIAYSVYRGASDYVIKKAFDSEIKKEFIQQTGIDLSESARVLTLEEVEQVQILFQGGNGQVESNTESNTESSTASSTSSSTSSPKGDAEAKDTPQTKGSVGRKPSLDFTKPVTTDDVRQALEQRAEHILTVVPTKDKNAMMNLVLGNIPMSDINYLMGLASDGLSQGDIQAAKQIAIEKFDDAELETVRGYYYQYKHLLY